MGSAVSAKAADEREEQKLRIKQERNEQRQMRRFMRHIEQHYGELNYDEKGVPFYINNNNDKVYIDEYGHEHFYEDSGDIYYLDEKGGKFYLDENREPYYLDGDGTKYFIDTTGNKYYFDENGEPFLVENNQDDENDSDDEINSEMRPDSKKPMNDSRLLAKEEVKLRSTTHSSTSSYRPFESNNNSKETTGNSFCLSRRNYHPNGKHLNSIKRDMNRNKVDSVDYTPSMENIDHPNSDTYTGNSCDDSLSLDDTLSSYSTLSFMRSEYEMVISDTPDYIKDTSEESETRITAQVEAQHKMFRKLLEKEQQRETTIPKGKNYTTVGRFNIKIKTDSKDCNIVDSVFLPSGNLILVDSNNKVIKQFNENLEYVNHLEMEEKPYSVCAEKDDDIVHVTFQSRAYDGIKALKVNKSSISVQKMIKLTSGSPFGIARSNKGLAVVMSTKEGWEIHLRTLNLNLSRIVKLENEEMKCLSSPYYVVLTQTLNIIISDKGNNSVYRYDTNGKIVSKYEELREPLSVCSDRQGSLFVVSPGVVHQISETGERIKALMRRETTKFALVSACYDVQDCLLVLAGKSNFVMAYEIKT